ncbi:MAG: putative endonuclease [Candidatus Paceibacteria bacterium]|jgi:putative endonuclease
MKNFTSKTQIIGQYGEDICTKWLQNNDYSVIERNFTKKEGEIDIIAEKTNILHFIEVKSVTREKKENVLRERSPDEYNPAQNVTREKIAKCFKVISQYKQENNVSYETKTQFDVYTVYIDPKNIKHTIERIENCF